ncbi:ATP-binding protein [Sphingomonas sp. SUN039]|uniref:ATP-binding protein n=1 Tax=Sphingomonas sp. SUN039 TaxID=2937787 RepID=UPI0021641292|nr:ATP-binding protein [Sphingomonas sp. SUN039]UVO55469.1 ATP-binding protein [Sphingomonas sp. SUN039]
MDDTLRRIAAALDRIAPLGRVAPLPDARACRWDGSTLTPAAFRPLPLDLLTGIDEAKSVLVENCRRHAAGHAAHDALLWGARGSGKSALAKSAVGATAGLTLVELAATDLATLPVLFDVLAAASDRRVVVFIDDLGFDDVQAARVLRSVLDGGASARPDNVRLYVTSNRRHIVKRDMAEQGVVWTRDPPGAGHGHGAGSRSEPWAINPRDAADDALALADRFGLSLGFHVADQPTYLAMVGGYASAYGLPFDPADAVQFATQRGSRSGRVAWHYVVELAGRAGRGLG